MYSAHRSFVSIAVGALLATSASLSAQTVQVAGLPTAYPKAKSGQAAIASLGSDAASIAAKNGLSVNELIETLEHHDTAWLTTDGLLMFVDTAIPLVSEDEYADIDAIAPKLGTTFAEAFSLHSRPSSNITIYLDFDGHHSVNNSWGHNIMFPAFDTSGDPTIFTAGELDSIVAQWKRVAEDFAPFDVNVTTEEPPVGDLRKQGGGDTRWGGRCIMTQPTSGFGSGIGGVAFLNSFDDSIDNPCFTFNKGNNNGSMTASHEVGHMLGLSHDGLNGAEYHPGAGGSGATGWGPIMGAPFGKNLVQWSDGSYAGSTQTQNDLNIITKTANGITTLADDYGDAIPSTEDVYKLSCPNPGTTVISGLIETRNDVDTFRFKASGGPVRIDAVPLYGNPNMDILMELYDSNGALVDSNNFIGQVTAFFDDTLAAGEYTIMIDGTERLPRYDDYGTLGLYTVTIAEPVWTSVGPGSGSGPQLTGFGVACELEPIELAMSGAPASSTVFVAFGWDRQNVPFHGGTLVPDLAAQGGVHVVHTNADGRAKLTDLWPAGVPIGTRISYQAWMLDPSTPQGYSSTNAVELTVR